jgi:potassium-transporting ATPase KdpC subunit
MLIDLRRGLVTLAAFTVLCGLAYPLAVLGVGQVAFRGAAEGSLQRDGDGAVVGSALIGQGFDQPGYFWGRPSAAGENGYDPGSSGASNLGPTSADLDEAVRERLAALLEAHALSNPGARPEDVPAELVTASASGLDPHISPAGAEFQVGRVAQARGLDPGRVRELVREHTEGRTLGFLGEPRVNVLRLNLALDGEAATR